MSNPIPKDLPGDLPKQELIEQMVRVNHAGEYGAKRIYEGQLAVLKGKQCEDTIRHMAEQEEVHLKTFDDMIVNRRVRPTALMPIWHVAGFALGAATALMGEKAAMACTVAVEEVIDEHYAEQYAALDESESELKETIETFRQEELEHRDIGLENKAKEFPAFDLLSSAIKTGSRTAIWLSKRL